MGAPGENVSAPVHTVLGQVELAARVSYNTGEGLTARFLDELNRLPAIPKHDSIKRMRNLCRKSCQIFGSEERFDSGIPLEKPFFLRVNATSAKFIACVPCHAVIAGF
jgi:hypothetical protein